MAGGKETPRQKMIGMMYLVLTALLALQVSSAIIQKFKFLDDSLMHVNETTTHENNKVASNIKKIVEQEGNKDAHIVAKTDEVRKVTDELLAYMNSLRKRLIDDTGGVEEDGNYKGAKEEDKVAILMLGPEGSKNGEAYKLKDRLNGYTEFLRKFGLKEAPFLALDGKDDPMFKNDKEQANKDFAQLNFAQTPMVAALAVLAQKESEILKYEAEILAKLASEVGASDIKFDNVVAMVRPSSKVVAAGTKYEAEMFLAASSSAITPTMEHNGRPVKVDPVKKIGKVEFVAQGGAYDKEGNFKTKWKGAIKFKHRGKDTTFQVEEEYIVAKPVIQIQSASVSALYKNCGNELNVQVPALGSTYNPSFGGTGGKFIPGAQKGLITIVPDAPKVVLNVSSNGNLIGSQEFGVRLIPKPTIEALKGAAPLNEKQGEAAPGPASITMKAVPDESFKTFLPKDARYKVAEWECILVRGKRPVGAPLTFTTETGSLATFRSQAQPGDRILIEVKKVTRTNFLNNTEEVNVGTIIKNIPLN
ncbi:MAG: gliding motility protein GldM [Cytophagaceae bacterium]